MKKYFAFISNFINFFRRRSDDDRKLMDKLRDKYRLVIMNDDTFEEVTSVKLTPLAVYVSVSSLIVGTAILVTTLIVLTPLKRYIPGYGDLTRDAEIAELTNKKRELEKEVAAQGLMIKNIQKLMTGDLADITKEEMMKQGKPETTELDSIPEADIERIPEDGQMRAAVATGSFTAPPQSAETPNTPISRDVPLQQMFFVPPVNGDVTAAFDPVRSHFGIDIAGPKSAAIKSVANGVVISAGFTVETGHSIAVQHPNNVVTIYKHNSVLLKREGSNVKAGEAIAIIGNSGENTTGPHLHFELWYKGRAVNPKDYIHF
jgi:murein DD-endopeptidase MepM/ murein hydrolase activator NlpD